MKKLKSHLSGQQVKLGLSSTLFALMVFMLLLLAARQLAWLEPLELTAYDWMTRQQPDIGLDERLLVVEITEADIRAQERWPLSDGILATAMRKLNQYQPAVIGLDNYRDFPQQPGHEELIEQLQQPNVIVIRKLGQDSTPAIPAPKYVAPEQIGFNDLVVDRDGVVRRSLLFASFDEQIFPAFSLILLTHYLEQQHTILPGNTSTNPQQFELGQAVMLPLQKTSGAYQNVDARGYQILLRYRTGKKVARHVTLAEVLADKVDPDWIKNKIVIIGTTAYSIKDGFSTPFSTIDDKVHMPGVYIHAQIISQILTAATGDFANATHYEHKTELLQLLGHKLLFNFWSDKLELFWIILWAILGAGIAWRIHQPLKLGLVLALGMTILLLSSLWWFIYGYWVPVATPMLAFLIAGITVLSAQLVYDALYDSLTGLPNRTFLVNKFKRIQNYYCRLFNYRLARNKNQIVVAILLWDIDRFKILNVVLGHNLADLLLIQLSYRIQHLMQNEEIKRNQYFLSRVGGNEFALMLKLPRHVLMVRHMAETIQKAIQQPFMLEKQEVFVTTSMGIALSHLGEHRDLLRDAYAAMYRAKLSHARLEIFQSSMEFNAIAKFELERDLRQAIVEYKEFPQQRAEIFPVYYQPLIDLATGEIIGFEALLRWQHPQRGLVPPGVFIPVAEDTGLILTLGEWVLEEACRQAYAWQQAYPLYADIIISVNLSAKQFVQVNLIDNIQKILNNSKLSAACLKLEITESVVMDDFKLSIAMLSLLKNLGIKLGIDDFGTGYSSLSYLTQMPADTLKIDKSFVMSMQSPADLIIVETIITLAHSLNMNIIAEGIEEIAHALELRQLGCEYGQGYYFAKPLPWPQAEQLLAESHHFRFFDN